MFRFQCLAKLRLKPSSFSPGRAGTLPASSECAALCPSASSALLPAGCRRAQVRTPFTIHNSPFTIHNSPFTIHNSPFTIHNSPFTIHNSQSATIHNSPFTIHNPPPPPFTNHHKPSETRLLSRIAFVLCEIFHNVLFRDAKDGQKAGPRPLPINQHA